MFSVDIPRWHSSTNGKMQFFSVTALGAGDSTAVGPLEFEVQSNGKPTVTPAI